MRIPRIPALPYLLLVLVQVPAVATLAHIIDSGPLALALAALFSSGALPELRRPGSPHPRSRPRLLSTLLFYAWWTSGLAFLVLGPLALAAAALLGQPRDRALALGGLAALVAGARSVWTRPRLVSRTITVPGLPAALDGYRIAQLTDVHCGPFTPARRVRRWVARINAQKADLVAVTGDLIASGSLYVQAVSEALGGLRATDGVFACLGNHEYFTDAEAFVHALERAGLTVLRNRGVPIARGGAQLFVAGVDDTWTGRSDVPRALAERPEGAPAILLAHDPNLFPEAARQGVEVTLSGHTHGGQLAVPGLARRLSLARFITIYPAGLFRLGRAALYVSRGAGTTGPPIRLGAPAELTVLTLRTA